MKFFFDESGRFAAHPDTGNLCASVVTGVAISELHADEIREEFESFVAGLDEKEVKNGEPKGSKLSKSSRERFCDFVEAAAPRGILISPVFVDMSLVPLDNSFFGVASYSKHIGALAEQADDESKKAELLRVAEMFGRLSEPQAWRLHTWGIALKEILERAIRWLCADGHEHHWDQVLFELDEVDTRGEGLESEVFVRFIHPWLSAYSRVHPAVIFEEVHTEENPFTTSYVADDGLRLDKLLDGNVRFGDSRTSWGLQIADIASNIVFRAVHKASPDDVQIWKRLERVCSRNRERSLQQVYAASDLGLLIPSGAKYAHMF